jgi:hypothetical protein
VFVYDLVKCEPFSTNTGEAIVNSRLLDAGHTVNEFKERRNDELVPCAMAVLWIRALGECSGGVD